MFKNFLLNQFLKSKLKDIPEDQQQKLIKVIGDNPDFFMKMANDVKKEVDAGKNQSDAIMTVMKKYESDIKNMLQ